MQPQFMASHKCERHLQLTGESSSESRFQPGRAVNFVNFRAGNLA